ncbi:hypothetical protein A1O3_07333 [Capronia epimyces CBS 606.96]|uniref:Major facilitator superfamily (MFS) profile domain-containing protein n=1 Tax=Capronia epimyces CBS 606.96 TaxID=1182542 RepID=W9XUM5_9EURO|nr:uncharacterized protein A1O3_07333 [Capronia epimyces CBS 606.96]EXJ81045.1 hypothetical protein A1O3_07333 [Capronia epimyces CBS 606.96]
MADIEDKTKVADVLMQKEASFEAVAASEALSPAEDRRLLRRADMWLLPVLFVTYMFQYLDKSTMANAAILGLRSDLHLQGQDYSWASSVFNFGYLAASGPIAFIIVRLPIGKFMSVSVLLWGAVLMCMAATKNSSGLIATRFFLGFMEAAVAPGFSIIVSLWYKRSEQPLRTGVWFLGNIVSGFFAGPLMYAFGHIHSYPAWKIVFLTFGGLTVVWGAVMFFILPDAPGKAWFFRPEDRPKAVLRINADSTGVKHNKWKMDQFWEALCDPKAWFTALLMLATNIPNGGISNFAAIVIHGFGFSVNETFLVNMIVTAFQGFFVLVVTIGSTYLPNSRTYFMMAGSTIGLIGAVVIRQLDNSNIWARYSGYCLLSAYTTNFPMILVMNTSNNAGITKKTTVNAMSFVAYCVGNIVGPQLFFDSEAPNYPSGFAAMLVCFCVTILATFALRLYLIWCNKKKDRISGPVEDQALATELEDDRTDREMDHFRYIY